jgi:preprotein translocase subunit SecF
VSQADDPAVVARSTWGRLYHGETNIDFVGRRRLWLTISVVAVLIGLGSLLVRGLNLGIDFEGGVVWEVPAGDASVAEARELADRFGLEDATVQILEADQGDELRIASQPVDGETTDEVTAALADLTGTATDDVNLTSVGPSWGRELSDKAIRALVVFLVLVTAYITVRFQLKMAIPTLVALIHDVLITVGVYSLTQLPVTPATVIAILTILGYSVYDTIVVFDKVDENTSLVSSAQGMTYGDMVNLSLNQALMRSLNTSITALLPVGSLLIVGAWIMGASTLEEFALALLVGLFAGTYSSIFVASPLLSVLKDREARYRDIQHRAQARASERLDARSRAATLRQPEPATVGQARRSRASGGDRAGRPTPSGRVIPPRPRKKTRRRR